MEVRFVLALCIALFGVLVSILPAAAATFTVNSTADAVDANPGNGICAASGGACTLRAAIMEANTPLAAERLLSFRLGFIF